MPNAPENPDHKHKIFLVDDHDLVRFGAAQLISRQPDLTVCGEACSVVQALPMIRNLCPDLVVADISLKESNGIEMVKAIRSELPRVAVLVMSMHDELIWAEVAIRAGAAGYLMKENSIDKLLPAIRTILSGRMYLSEPLAGRLLEQQLSTSDESDAAPLQRLSPRELQVLQMLGQWKSTKQIAAELNISVKTVEYYKEQLKQKLKLRTAAELTQYALNFTNG